MRAPVLWVGLFCLSLGAAVSGQGALFLGFVAIFFVLWPFGLSILLAWRASVPPQIRSNFGRLNLFLALCRCRAQSNAFALFLTLSYLFQASPVAALFRPPEYVSVGSLQARPNSIATLPSRTSNLYLFLILLINTVSARTCNLKPFDLRLTLPQQLQRKFDEICLSICVSLL